MDQTVPHNRECFGRLIITGANGWVGRNAYHVLKDRYDMLLLDFKAGDCSDNRFAIENADASYLAIPKDLIIRMDLATERGAFTKLLTDYKPNCVLHCAGVLETQEIKIIEKNNDINKTVLESCAEHGVDVIAMSSIMVMFGAAISHDKIRAVLERKPLTMTKEDKLRVEDPLKNNEVTMKQFNSEHWEKWLVYIKSKETLEEMARSLVRANPKLTMVSVRLGWSGIKNPYVLEEGSTGFSGTSFYLDQVDLQSFVNTLVDKVVQKKPNSLNGYHCYFCVSQHPQSWVNQSNAEVDIGWVAVVDIQEKYQVKKVIK
jgi:nucleoside-diphosphate-sugar epimerase